MVPGVPVTRALVPAAGRGTRLRPLTDVVPKELLPLVDRPVVRWVADELAACGIEQLAVVVGPGKERVAEYLGAGAILQPEPRGLGDAVLCAEAWAADEPFAVALGDAVIGGQARIVARLAAALDDHGAVAAIAVQRVGPEKVSRYGIVAGATKGSDPFVARALVEKPALEDAPGDMAIAARYVLGPAIFDALRATAPGHGGEVQLTDAIALLLREGARVVAVPLAPGEPRFDVGDAESYAEAFVTLALEDPRFGDRLRARLDAQRGR
jgi:UTP--glucose-1-phosphate uridylyltransferase